MQNDNYQTPEQETILKSKVSSFLDKVEKANGMVGVLWLIKNFREEQLKTAEVIKNPNARKW